jgi:hypothetical protein
MLSASGARARNLVDVDGSTRAPCYHHSRLSAACAHAAHSPEGVVSARSGKSKRGLPSVAVPTYGRYDRCMETPRAFVIAQAHIAHDVRDLLAQAGLLMYSVEYGEGKEPEKLMAVRVEPSEVHRCLTPHVPSADFRVHAELSPEQLDRLSSGARLMVATSQQARAAASRPPHDGASWETPGLEAPRKLRDQS